MTKSATRQFLCLMCLIVWLAVIICLRVYETPIAAGTAANLSSKPQKVVEADEHITTAAQEQSKQPTACEEYYTEQDIVLIAKTLYGECRGCSETEQAKVAWCILNRVDDERFPDTIEGVVTQPHQFHGYRENNPICEQQYRIATEVLSKWAAEKEGAAVERELPNTYCFFSGDGTNNYFREVY